MQYYKFCVTIIGRSLHFYRTESCCDTRSIYSQVDNKIMIGTITTITCSSDQRLKIRIPMTHKPTLHPTILKFPDFNINRPLVC
jgi:hypothetical protein